MIVYTKDDLVKISGSIKRNHWLTIKAAANLLLQEYPEGIVIDCAELSDVTDDGAMTFLDAVRDIQEAHSRMVVCNLPKDIKDKLSAVPGVKSQLPVSASVEEARNSLRQAEVLPTSQTALGIIVPVSDLLDTRFQIMEAVILAKATNLPINLVRCLVVSRSLPLGAPLPEEENKASAILHETAEIVKSMDVYCTQHVERVREECEGIVQAADTCKAQYLMLAVRKHQSENSEVKRMIDIVVRRAPCPVIVSRC